MRPYPPNSPQAAARIVALTMLVDGHMSDVAARGLSGGGLSRHLGLEPGQWRAVVQGLCEDLLSTAVPDRAMACAVGEHTLAALMAEIDDPELRARVLNLCVAIVEADAHVSKGEAILLGAAVEHWSAHRQLRRRAPVEALAVGA